MKFSFTLIMILFSLSVFSDPFTKFKQNLNSSIQYDSALIEIAKGNESEYYNYIDYLNDERKRVEGFKRSKNLRDIFSIGLIDRSVNMINSKIVLSSYLHRSAINEGTFWGHLNKNNSKILSNIFISLNDLILSHKIDTKVHNTLKSMFSYNIRKYAFKVPKKYDPLGKYQSVLDISNLNDFYNKSKVLIFTRNSQIIVANNDLSKKKPTVWSGRKQRRELSPKQKKWAARHQKRKLTPRQKKWAARHQKRKLTPQQKKWAARHQKRKLTPWQKKWAAQHQKRKRLTPQQKRMFVQQQKKRFAQQQKRNFEQLQRNRKAALQKNNVQRKVIPHKGRKVKNLQRKKTNTPLKQSRFIPYNSSFSVQTNGNQEVIYQYVTDLGEINRIINDPQAIVPEGINFPGNP